jgi:hypothetical protein
MEKCNWLLKIAAIQNTQLQDRAGVRLSILCLCPGKFCLCCCVMLAVVEFSSVIHVQQYYNSVMFTVV